MVDFLRTRSAVKPLIVNGKAGSILKLQNELSNSEVCPRLQVRAGNVQCMQGVSVCS